MDPRVLVVGAGPTGLFLTYLLARQGVPVRLIDRGAGPSRESRAMGVQARTLEFYRMVGLVDGALERGVPVPEARVWVNGRRRLGFSLGDMGAGISPYPYLLTLAQDVHEAFLLEQLATMGVTPDWGVALEGLRHDADGVSVTLSSGETARHPYVVGCDGGHSAVRQTLGVSFEGGTAEGLFFVADVELAGGNDALNLGLGPDAITLLMPVRTTGTQRMIGLLPPAMTDRDDLTFDDVAPGAAPLVSAQVTAVNWFSTYRVHHRVAERFAQGRVFLAGDAGHVHSPVGGQGMNTGLGDAMNLGWKLGAVMRGVGAPALLDTYDSERRAFAQVLIQSTDRAFQTLIRPNLFARMLRQHVLPLLVSIGTRLPPFRKRMFQTISQTRIAYPDSALSRGRVGTIRAGDRLPWVKDHDLTNGLDGERWVLVAMGTPPDGLRAPCKAAGVVLSRHVLTPALARAGFSDGAVYLLRPDGHVGLALEQPDANALQSYLDQWIGGTSANR